MATEHCIVCFVCERFLIGLFPTVWIFPTGFSHRGFFHAGVWAHPAKLTICSGPRSVCMCVLQSVVVEVHGCAIWL